MKIISSKSAKEIITKEANKKSLVFFVGAGVSKILPSNLPLGNEIKNSIIKLILRDKELAIYKSRILNSTKFKRAIPELVFQPLYETLEDKIFQAFEILNSNNFNHIHESLAWFNINKKCSIYTTNFDMLIENSPNTNVTVEHLHGAINKPNEMTTRIYQVGRGIPRREINKFKKINDSKILCVIGYSGNDKDIAALINGTKFNTILWLVKDLKDEWTINNINRINNHNTCVFKNDLNYFFKDFIKQFKIPITKSMQSTLPEKKVVPIKKYAPISFVEALRCIQSVFYILGDYKEALAISSEALKNKKIFLSPRDKIWFHQITADNITCIGSDFSKAVKHIKHAINISIAEKSYLDLAESYNALGNIYVQRNKSDSKLALDALRQAKKYCQMIKTKALSQLKRDQVNVLFGKIYNNIGLCYDNDSNYPKAIDSYQKSIAYKKTAGNITAVAVTGANLSLSYRSLNQNRKSNYWKQQAEEIFKLYGLFYRLGYLYREFGIRTNDKYRTTRLKYLNEALKIYTSNVPNAEFDIKLTLNYIQKVK